MIIILFLTRFESTYLKASNSVEARLESKENSESGQSQIYNAGYRWNVFFSLPVTPSGGSDSVSGPRDSVSPALPAIDRWPKFQLQFFSQMEAIGFWLGKGCYLMLCGAGNWRISHQFLPLGDLCLRSTLLALAILLTILRCHCTTVIM